ncbi:MAG: hypothetical protein ACK446_14985, partial [Rhodobacterales bacterium]
SQAFHLACRPRQNHRRQKSGVPIVGFDPLGLVLDSDPRRVTKTGSAQTSDPASDPAVDPEDDPAQPEAAQQE